VYKVIPAYRGSIAVAGHDNHVQIGIGELDPSGERYRSPMRRMEGVEVEIARSARSAADARHHAHLVLGQVQPGYCPEQRVEYDAVTAARAPDVGHELRAKILIY
jgi:hypothetical protein